MKIIKVKVVKCALNLGELHRLKDFEHINPEFVCEKESGEQFTASMRLHIAEPLDGLIFADPGKFADKGIFANSVGSTVIARKKDYNTLLPSDLIPDPNVLLGIDLFEIDAQSLITSLLDGYNFYNEREKYLSEKIAHPEIAFTCHDPNIIGGGNVILFRLINWLSDLGIKVTVYSCGKPPSWKRVSARFKFFKTYKEMFENIEERIVVLYSMWHIEPMMKADPEGKLIYHIRQIYEPYHYGRDYETMIARKPAIEILETLPIGLITISPHLEDYYKRLHNFSGHLISNGVDPNVFYPTKKNKRKPNEIKIVSVGNPDHFVKGTVILYKALKILAEKRKNITFRWNILTGVRGKINYNDSPKNLLIEQLTGLNQLKMRKEYSGADIAVNPSLYEGYGLPTIEAMMCGTPVVQADNMGLDFIVEDKKDCLIVPVNNPQKTAEAMEKLLDDAELTRSLAEGGYAKAMQNTTRHQFGMFLTAFNEILNVTFEPDRIEAIEESFGYEINKADPLNEVLQKEKMYNPLVSVILPSYNQAEYLREALDSIIAQTYSNWEAIVVNDGSKDHTEEVMNEYAAKDSRIRLFTKQNGGITSALNAGLENARGEYFCWLSSDDLFYPNKLELQVKMFEGLDESYALVYGSFDILQESETTKELQKQPFMIPLINGCEFPEALKFDFIDGCTIMIRMKVMREVKGFNPGIVHSQDMELWLRLASRGYRFELLPHKLTIRRVHIAQSSTLNMIHCRYDAAWMINFYLVNYHLLEMYRYINFNSEKGIHNFVEHFVSRTFDTEANVNHPLLQEKFWNWFKDGIKVFPVEIQNVLLQNCLIHFTRNLNITYKIKYYIEQCIEELQKQREQKQIVVDYCHIGRDFRETDRSTDVFASDLFDYGIDLLVNENTPLFAQELYFHGTNKLVDTPFKLAHSAFRYLSQFSNPYKESVKTYIGLDKIPQTKEEAIELFFKLRFPDFAGLFLESYNLKSESDYDEKRVASVDDRIAQMPAEYKDQLRKICTKNPTIGILHYWNALTYSEENKIFDALDEAWKVIGSNSGTIDLRMLIKIVNWAQAVKDYEKAYYASLLASGLNPNSKIVADLINNCKKDFLAKNKIIPHDRQKYFKKENRSVWKVKIQKCKVNPMLNGMYSLDIECTDELNNKYSTKGSLPYKEEMGTLIVTDYQSGRELNITPDQLYNYWSHGYNFYEALDTALRNRLVHNNKTSVAFLAPHASVINGGTLVILRMANWLSDLGIKVAVYSTQQAPDWFDLKCSFITRKSIKELYQSINEEIIIAYSVLEIPELLEFHVESKRIFHIAQVIEDFHYHGFDYESLMMPKGVFELLHSLPVGRISVSKHIADYLSKHYNQQSFLIENGIDLINFLPRWVKPFSNEVTICTVGNTRRILKGVDDVVRGVEILSVKLSGYKFNVIIVNNGKADVDQQLKYEESKINITVLYDLSQEEMKRVYYRSDVYVNASWYEGFGLPTLEAMACGIPVIQADNLGLRGVVEDGKNCLLFRPAKYEDLAIKLEKLVCNEILRKTLITGGLDTVKNYSLANHFDNFIKVFEDILVFKFNGTKVSNLKKKIEKGSLYDKIKLSKTILNPKISIVIPVFANDSGLKETIESLHAQIYENWDAVIVYNNADEYNKQLITNYSCIDRRIKIKKSDSDNFGELLNKAVRLCEGEWITFMYGGTTFDPNRLVNQINYININPLKKIIFTDYYIHNGKENKAYDNRWLKSIPSSLYQLPGLFNYEYIIPPLALIHNSLIEEFNGFDSNYNEAALYHLLLKSHVKNQSVFYMDGTCVCKKNSRLFANNSETGYRKAICDLLKNISFKELFPFVDFENTSELWKAVLSLYVILGNKNSLINNLNLGELLKSKITEWSSTLHDQKLLTDIENLKLSHENGTVYSMKGLFHEYKFEEQIKPELPAERKTGKTNNSIEVTDNRNYIDFVNPVVSIILITYNQINYTLECLESVKEFTNGSYEILVVDNASDDDTVNRLRSRDDLKLIENKRNFGFPAAVNQGINHSRGKYICILNNDTVLTKGWLERMIVVAETDPGIGLVGPISNEVSGLQIDKDAKYTSIKEMRSYAKKVLLKNKNEILHFPRIAFLCTLIKKEVIDKIGGLDERFSPGNYEDDDFCLRAQIAGFKTVIAKDVFIHHYGSKSFKADGEIKYAERLEINKQKFIDKWGVTPDELWLQNKPIKTHQYKYPINKDLCLQYFERSRVQLADKEYNLAFDSLDSAVKCYYSSERKGLEIMYDELLNLAGNTALLAGEIGSAQRYFEEELNTVPNSSSACIGLGQVFLANGIFENAKVMFEWGITNNPENKSAAVYLSKVNILLGLAENHNSLVLK